MDLSRIEIIGAFALLTFSLYPVLHGDVNLLTFWELVVTLSLSSGFTLLFLGTKSELEKTRIKINVITENKTTTYKEELKVSSIIFKNVEDLY